MKSGQRQKPEFHPWSHLADEGVHEGVRAMPVLDPVRLVHIMTVPYAFTYIKGQVGYMKKRGFEVYGLSSPGELLSQFAEKEKVLVHAVKMTKRITPIRDLAALCRICSWLRRVRPAIVDSHTPKGGFLGMLGAWLVGVPVRIYHLHGLRFMTASGWKRRLLLMIERMSCQLAQEVICVSASVQQLAVEHGLCPARKIKVLVSGSINGVDSSVRFNPALIPPSERIVTRDKYQIPADAMVIGFVGRLVWSKGIVELSQAWMLLREEFSHVHLLMVGGAESEDPVPVGVAERLRKDPRVHLTGEDWNTPPLYAAMDLVVLPTYREGFPTVVLETAAMSLPVVATSVPGCIDAVRDGVTGTLVPPYDAVNLAEAMRNYLKNPELRKRHGAAARELVVRQYSQEVIWNAMYEEYIRCLENQNIAQRYY